MSYIYCDLDVEEYSGLIIINFTLFCCGEISLR